MHLLWTCLLLLDFGKHGIHRCHIVGGERSLYVYLPADIRLLNANIKLLNLN